jgi:hypothetical protein
MRVRDASKPVAKLGTLADCQVWPCVQITVNPAKGKGILHAAAKFVVDYVDDYEDDEAPYVWVKTPGPAALQAQRQASVPIGPICDHNRSRSGGLIRSAGHGLTMHVSYKAFSRLLEIERRLLLSSQAGETGSVADVGGGFRHAIL